MNATLIENYSQTYIETCLAGDSSACTKRKVAAYEIWDLSGGYTRFANATLRLGINMLGANQSLFESRGLLEALAKGARMVVVDPAFTATAEKASEWIPIAPGTNSLIFRER